MLFRFCGGWQTVVLDRRARFSGKVLALLNQQPPRICAHSSQTDKICQTEQQMLSYRSMRIRPLTNMTQISAIFQFKKIISARETFTCTRVCLCMANNTGTYFLQAQHQGHADFICTVVRFIKLLSRNSAYSIYQASICCLLKCILGWPYFT